MKQLLQTKNTISFCWRGLLRIKHNFQHLIRFIFHTIFPHIFLTLLLVDLLRLQGELPHLLWLYGFTACFIVFAVVVHLEGFMPRILKAYIIQVYAKAKSLVYVFLLIMFLSFEHGYRGAFPELEWMTVFALIICGLCVGHHTHTAFQHLRKEIQS